MTLSLAADPLPLAADSDGRIRIAGKRVFLVNFINLLSTGLSTDEMVRRFDMLDPADIHAVIAYYLRNKEKVDEYVHERNAEAKKRLEMIESELPPKVTAEELRARWAARQGQ